MHCSVMTDSLSIFALVTLIADSYSSRDSPEVSSGLRARFFIVSGVAPSPFRFSPKFGGISRAFGSPSFCAVSVFPFAVILYSAIDFRPVTSESTVPVALCLYRPSLLSVLVNTYRGSPYAIASLFGSVFDRCSAVPLVLPLARLFCRSL